MNAEVQIDDFTIGIVPSTMIDIIWDKVKPHLEKVVEKSNDFTIESTYDRLVRNDSLLLTVSRGADIIAVNTVHVETLSSGVKTLYIGLVGGDELDIWSERMLKFIEAIAKDYGCTELRGMVVRKGWLKKMQPYGWSEAFTTVRYKIGE